MKKLFTLPIAALLLAGCTNDSQIVEDNNINGVDNVARSYLSISLLTPASSTRVYGDDEVYVNGSESENFVNTIRFFFFDEEGNPANVWKNSVSGTYNSYIDWEPIGQGEAGTPGGNTSLETGGTVEKIMTATLGINVPEGEENPSLVLAVLNPTSSLLNLSQNPSLSDLRDIVSDYYTGLYDSNFVITNSVYVSRGGDIIDATPISEENFGISADDENMETLVIYVERVLARLDFSLALTNDTITDDDGNTLYLVSEKTVGGNATNIYVKLLGWNLTTVTDNSRLVKKIDTLWEDDLFGDLEIWNADNYHRSFWAINPPQDEYGYLYGDFDGDKATDFGSNATEENLYPAMGLDMPNDENPVMTVYMQENAAIDDDGDGAVNPTKVIIATQLVDENGEPVQLAHWANRYYTQEGLLNALANQLSLYQQQTVNGNIEYTKITPDQIEYVSVEELEMSGSGSTDPSDTPQTGDETEEAVPQYMVTVQLTEAASAITWYDGNNPETATALSTAQANSYIRDRVGNMMVWTSGYGYYYADIKHLGAEGRPGYFGVVRNHIYDTKLTKLAGISTPVFDPDQVIYPQKPEYDDNVITAEVRILQWRIVTQDFNIEW